MLTELIIFVIVLIFSYKVFGKKQKWPPGPWRFPIIGSSSVTNVEECMKMKEKYGKMFMTQTGSVKFLFLTDYKLSKEAYNKLEFSDRPKWKMFHLFQEEIEKQEANGIITSNGSHWHHNRRFLLQHLRDLGMGKSKIEDMILGEVECLLQDFRKRTLEPSVLPFSINFCALNVIWQLVAGHRYDYEDEKIEEFMKKVNEIQDVLNRGGLPDFYPWLGHLLPKSLLNYVVGRDKINETRAYFISIVKPFIDEHAENLDPLKSVDLMDDYLIELLVRKSEQFSHFSIADLMRTTYDLFIAGNDTTANMTRWVLLYMAKFQEIQVEVQKRLDRVVSHGKIPGLEHRSELSYLDATINEVHRHCSMISFGAVRCVNRDIAFNGYFIPKGTAVLTATGIIHKDMTYWNNPHKFDPERFLDADGKFIPTCDGFQPFGIAERHVLYELNPWKIITNL